MPSAAPPPPAEAKPWRPRFWTLVAAAAVLLAAVGATLGVFGAYLAYLGGSPYYVIAGLALLVSAYLLALRRYAALHVFAALYLGTAAWSYWEVGLDFWGWLPRFAPFVVMGGIMGALSRGLSPAYRYGRPFAAVQLVLAGLGAWALFTPQGVITHDGPAELVATGGPAPDWRFYGGDAGATHHAALSQITRDNVRALKVAWTFHTGEPNAQSEAQATPLQIGDSLFFCTSHNKLFSLSASSGRANWTFDPKVVAAGSWNRCRGVGYFDADAAQPAGASALPRADVPSPGGAVPLGLPKGAACRQRVIATTVDATMFALDAATGRRCADFGTDGMIDLKRGMGKMKPGWYYLTSAPLIANGQVIIGGWVSDNASSDEPSGVVRAFSATSGKLLWVWDAGFVPGARPSSGDFTRSTPNMWGTGTFDAKLGLVYFPTGNSTPDHWGLKRTAADDRFSTSVVALHVDTGKLAWVFQTVHHDLWDYDLSAPPTLVDLPDGKGGVVPALVQVGKAGQIFLLDRTTGRPVSRVEERPVPQGGMSGERLSPTQPFSVDMPQLFPPFDEKRMWGATFFDQLACRIAFRKLDWRGQYTPPSLKHVAISPGYVGGFNWGGVAVDTARRMLIVNDIRLATIVRLVPRAEADRNVQADFSHAGYELHPAAGTPYGVELASFLSPLGLPCDQPPWGNITGIDLVTKKVAWQTPAGTLAATLRDMTGFAVPIPIGMPTVSSAITTRSGLTFYTGFNDEYVRAYDTATGRELWRSKMPFGSQATPMTYVSPKDGRQYLLVYAGGSARNQNVGDLVIAYALSDSPTYRSR